MAWNEPGSGDKDPWGNRGNDGPPDLDEVVRNMQRKLAGLFGGKGSNDNNQNGGASGESSFGIGLILFIAFLVWLASGIYIVDPAERGVVQRFGAYSETTMPGPHWHLPYPLEKVTQVDVSAIRTAEIGYRTEGNRSSGTIHSESLMLTKDENIVDLKIAVQYRIKNAPMYLFNVRNPDLILRQMMESAVRETVGRSNMDYVLTQGRSEIATSIETLLQSMLDDHETGLIVTSVNLQDVQPPEQVQAAFADVVKAREDEVRQKNEAEAYSNDILPKARGAAFRIIQEAEAYKSQAIAKAQGDTSRFLQIMKAYEQAPDVTRERLYLDTMESVYAKTPKVMIDTDKGSSNVFYLPLDKMRGNNISDPYKLNLNDLSAFPQSSNSTSNTTMKQTTSTSSPRDDVRSRGGR